MKRLAINFISAALLAGFSFAANAQDDKEKDKKKDVEQIIITLKGDKKDKVVIEIAGDKVTVNGKPSDELKDDDIKVLRNKFKTFEGLNAYTLPRSGSNAFNFDFDWNEHNGMRYFGTNENRAMLGVVTEKDEKGAKVTDVTEESAAEKAGIKEGDVITKINDAGINNPDELSEVIRKQKPGDKVTVTLLRDKKEQKVSAELGKFKGTNAFAIAPKMPDMKLFEETIPRVRTVPGVPYGQSWAYSGGTPKLGLSVQDTDDGKGVKVIEVDEESNAAKAGVKEDDIITHVNDKEVNGADEVAKLIRENKDKPSVRLQIKRNGKSQNIEVKMPRKLKTADL
jgi:serine protease Do